MIARGASPWFWYHKGFSPVGAASGVETIHVAPNGALHILVNLILGLAPQATFRNPWRGSLKPRM